MNELHEMNEHLQSIDKRLDRHIGVVEVILANQQKYMEALSSDLKEQRNHTLDVIDSFSVNYDNKLSDCKKSIEKELEEKIKTMESKAKLIAAVVSFIVGGLVTGLGLGMTAIRLFGGI